MQMIVTYIFVTGQKTMTDRKMFDSPCKETPGAYFREMQWIRNKISIQSLAPEEAERGTLRLQGLVDETVNSG